MRPSEDKPKARIVNAFLIKRKEDQNAGMVRTHEKQLVMFPGVTKKIAR